MSFAEQHSLSCTNVDLSLCGLPSCFRRKQLDCGRSNVLPGPSREVNTYIFGRVGVYFVPGSVLAFAVKVATLTRIVLDSEIYSVSGPLIRAGILLA